MGDGGRKITANLSPVWTGRQDPVSKKPKQRAGREGEGEKRGREKKEKRGENINNR